MTSPAIEKENIAPMKGVNTPLSEKKPATKGAKTKKAKVTKKKTVAAAPRKKAVSTHPTYEEMIKDAIVTLKERTGSSQYAIQKFIGEKHKVLSPSFRKLLLLNLKKLVASEKLVKVKASFKIPSTKPSSPKATAVTSAPEKKKKKKGAKVSKKPAASKPKPKTAPASKPKPKTKESSAKAAKTSTVTSPGKKAVAAAKKKAPTKKKTPVKKPKTVKSPVKRASRKAKK